MIFMPFKAYEKSLSMRLHKICFPYDHGSSLLVGDLTSKLVT